jgi:hypothetical protein
MAERLRNVNIVFTESEFKRLEQAKKQSESNTWHDFVLKECIKEGDDLK